MLKNIAKNLTVTKFYFDSIIISLNAVKSPLPLRERNLYLFLKDIFHDSN